MNFLELINKCLLELNYKQVNAISELVKNDHKRIMSILNVINKEICNVEPWNFLIRKTTLALPKGKTEIDNPVSGRIWYLIISGEKYKYSPDVESFLTEKTKTIFIVHTMTNYYSQNLTKIKQLKSYITPLIA